MPQITLVSTLMLRGHERRRKSQLQHPHLPFLEFMQRREVFTNVFHEVVLRILDPPILDNGVVEVFYDLVCAARRNG